MNIFLVGGAVRDALLNIEVQERDWVVVGASENELIDKGYKKIGVLGLSYKGNLKVDILSPVIPFVKHLRSKGINVSLFDPYYSNKEIGKIVGVKSFKYPP